MNNFQINDDSFEFLRKKLHIFFKVIGKDFITMLEEPIVESDSFNLMYAKVNKSFFRVCRMEISDINNDKYTTLLKKEDFIILLFILCIDCDTNSSLTKVISEKFKNNERNYILRSIEIHKKISF